MEDSNPSLQQPPLHTPLLDRPVRPAGRSLRLFILISVSSLISLYNLLTVTSVVRQRIQTQPPQRDFETTPFCNNNNSSCFMLPRGVAEGVSPKSNPSLSFKDAFNWTNAMFSWQRTAFHFQPQNNWMNG